MYRNSIALLILAAFAPAIAGQTTCAPCHREAKTQIASGMAKALERGEDARILKEHRRLTFTDHQFTYKIERDGNRSLYSVSNGADTLTVPIPWAFGLGEPGQTYVLEHNGKWYESRVSFYNVLEGLDFTLGARSLASQNLTEALGRELPVQEVAACFDCHSTNSVHGTEVDFQHLAPGVSCEACHGAAADHVASFKSREGDPDAETRQPQHGGNVRSVRPLPSYLGCHCGPRTERRRECALSALSADKLQVLRCGGPAHQLRGLPRSAFERPAAGVVLRIQMRCLSHAELKCESLPGFEAGLHRVPHAEG